MPGNEPLPEMDAKSWVIKAERDFLSIRNNIAGSEVPWDIVCFHAQQGVEKYLKGIIVASGRPPAWTHDLTLLLEACVELHADLIKFEEDCETLTKFAVSARYPGSGLEPSNATTQPVIAAAERMRATCRLLLPPEALIPLKS